MRWSSLAPSLVTRLYVRSGLTIHANFRRGLLACLAAAVVLAPGAGVGAATPRPDLTVSALTAKGSLVPGSRIRMTVTTRNSGAAPSKASTTRLYLSRDGRRSSDDRSLASTRIPGLAPGRSVTRTLAATVPATSPPAGRLLGCADTASRNAESREANNCRVTPDHDRDGYSSFGDCAPRNRAVHPGVNDQPDVPAFTDNNCDGIDGTARLAVFVSGVGSNDNPGTRARPKRTLSAAVDTAKAQGKAVYATFGEYNERLNVADGVGVYGGYGTDWKRSLSARTQIFGGPDNPSAADAALASFISSRTTLQHLTLAPDQGRSRGESSYGLRGYRSPGLVIERVVATADVGSTGADGRPGTPGRAGGAGQPGYYAPDTDDPDNGGAGGTAGAIREEKAETEVLRAPSTASLVFREP